MYKLYELGNAKSISKRLISYKKETDADFYCKSLQNITKNTVLTLKRNLAKITL